MRNSTSQTFAVLRAPATALFFLIIGFPGLDTALPCSPPPGYTLTTSVTGQGTVSPSGGTYAAGTVLSLTATPSAGWVFSNWQGALSGPTNPASLTMNSNKSVTAVFVQEKYDLTLSVNNLEAGTASASPSPGPEGYSSGTVVTLTASANAGWVFDHWEGNLTGSANPDTITMDSDKVVTAVFLPQFTLTTTVQGSGSITLAPPGGTYAQGTQVTLTAVPEIGWAFDHWEGAATGTSEVTAVTMNSNQSVTAVFVERYYTLSLNVNDPVRGSVTPSPAAGPQGYQAGTTVTLTATASSGFTFSHWTGDLGTSTNPQNLVMNANKSVTAVFVPEYTLTTMVIGSGTIELSPPGSVYPDGQSVTVTASPLPGWVFDHWEGAVTGGTNPTVVVMDASKSMTAVFLERFTLNVTTEGQGTVDPSGGVYTAGSQVLLTATPSEPDVYFIEWQGDLTGLENPALLTMDADKEITAVFARKFQVNTTAVGGGTVTPQSGLFAEGCEIELTATPDPNWAFDYWVGNLPGGTDWQMENMAVTIDTAMDIYAHFIERPGLTDLDMVGDLDCFLQAVGEGATAATFDRNEVEFDTEGNRVYVGNGILDAAELYLLETVLKTRHLDLTARSAIAHEPVWEAWRTNLAQAEFDLAGYDPRIMRAVAGYMTLGDFDTVESVRALVKAAFPGVTIDRANYDRSSQVYFFWRSDADNDGVWNIEEWQATSPTGSLQDIGAFAAAALDGDSPTGSPSPPGQSEPDCENDSCLLRGDLSARVGYLFTGPPGDSSADCAPNGEDIALGTRYSVSATPDGANAFDFVGWLTGSGQSSLLYGSRDRKESSLLLGNLEMIAFFSRFAMQIPHDDPNWITIEVGDQEGVLEMIDSENRRKIYGKPGSIVTLSAKSEHDGFIVEAWVALSEEGAADPKYNYQSTIQLPLGGYARPAINTEPPLTRQIRLVSSQGGTALASQTNRWGGRFAHSVRVYPFTTVDFLAVAQPGWEFARWIPDISQLGDANGASVRAVPASQLSEGTFDSVTVKAIFSKKREYTIDLEVDTFGGGDGRCGGHVSVEPAKRYYQWGEIVTVTATPYAGCCMGFDLWESDSDAINQVDSLPLDGNISEELTFAMHEDVTLRAVFRDLTVPETRNMIVHHVQPQEWTAHGYTGGDTFHSEYTGPVPDGWTWDGVLIGERLCMLEDDFGLTATEANSILGSQTGQFQIVFGLAGFPETGNPPDELEERSGWWICGQNLKADNHAIALYPTIKGHFENTDPLPASKSILLKQAYYISNSGQTNTLNGVNFGHKYIAETVIEFKFIDIPQLSDPYSPPHEFSPAHQVVQKGGAHNPVAWAGVPPWFAMDFSDEQSPPQRFGYGLNSGTDRSVYFRIVDSIVTPTAVP